MPIMEFSSILSVMLEPVQVRPPYTNSNGTPIELIICLDTQSISAASIRARPSPPNRTLPTAVGMINLWPGSLRLVFSPSSRAFVKVPIFSVLDGATEVLPALAGNRISNGIIFSCAMASCAPCNCAM
ncbi:MAG: hypothetical protein BWY14_01186 [Parcubacteria group bacterium ADurb.Bin192]|nr:MAG: hypothetical protein BWY14_01186 [Parcubacteria group bacterium ADurb.Bin192]